MIDSHAHLTSIQLAPTAEELVARAHLAGVVQMINICTDKDSLESGFQLRLKHPSVFLTAATTPHDVVEEGEVFFPFVEQAAREGKLVAIGETGLDYYYEHSPREQQQRELRRYLKLAHELNLPVVIHCRDAFADLFAILNEMPPVQGVLHCFTGTLSEAEQVIEREWYLSLSGIVTFKRSEELRAVARWVPLDRLLIETDAPYLAPQKYRGKQNEPAYLPEVAACIAQQKGMSFEEITVATADNARDLFNLSR